MSLYKYTLFIEAASKKTGTKPQAHTSTKELDKVNNLDDLLSGPKSKGSLTKPEPKAEPKGAEPKLKQAGKEKTTFKASLAKIDASKAPEFNTDELDTSQEMDDSEAAVRAGHHAPSQTTHGHKPKPVTPNM